MSSPSNSPRGTPYLQHGQRSRPGTPDSGPLSRRAPGPSALNCDMILLGTLGRELILLLCILTSLFPSPVDFFYMHRANLKCM
jgi:hypothetical protein